jgi:hypothetical protein
MVVLKSVLTLYVLWTAPLVVGAGIMIPEASSLMSTSNNMTDIRKNHIHLDPTKLQLDRDARMERQRIRRERARQKIASIKPDVSTLHRLTKEELTQAAEDDHPWVRRAGWSSSSNNDPYTNVGMADPSQEYDKWQQAYRMLGGFIDCDHKKSNNNNHKSGDQNQNQDGQSKGCSRWMMWAAVSAACYD